MSSSKNGEGVHVLVFPYPAQGHILPLLDLTHHLALRRITLTVLVTPKNLPILDPLLSAHPSIRTLVLPFPAGHPLLPAGVENVRDVGNWGNAPIMSSLSDLRRPIVDWFASHPDPPAAIIHDVFLGWVEEMAGEIGVPGICFYCHSAFLACVFEYGWRNMEKVKSLEVVDFEEMPKGPTFPREHLPSIMKNYKEGDPDWEGIRRGMIGNSKSWGVVVTTFHALEGVYLEFLKEKMGHGRVFPVGLLNLIGGPCGRGSGQGSLFAWLDRCPDESVLYVAFGSQKLMKQDQLEALCNGLERSGVRFILVVKEPSIQQMELGFGLVSNEFEDRVKGRGLVIRGWASQVDILSHRAVGAFLSHCGWNSALEAIVAGVLILGWPMEADQFVNAKLLVDDLGAAIRVCEGTDTVPDAAELARKISDTMNYRVLEKTRIKELRDEALRTVDRDEGSIECFEELVKQLGQLQAS